MSPSRTPPVTTRPNTDEIRPRVASVEISCAIVVRQTALMLSAAPATPSRTAASDDARRRPGGGDRPPQITTIAIVIRPSQRARVSQPFVIPAIAAPSETDA